MAADLFARASGSEGAQSLTFRATVHARPADVYSALTDTRDLVRMTRARAESEPRPGGAFMLYDGSIHGVYVALVPEESIEMKWRFRDWAESDYSVVHITLRSGGEGVTRVELTQTGIPVHDRYKNVGVLDMTARGWRERIFGGMQKCLGFAVDVDE